MPERPAPPPPAPTRICIYCQARPAVNEEHVVAKCFFGGVAPKRYIKVPACRECNAGRGDGGDRPLSMDEEYVRTVMVMEKNASSHPVAAKLLKEEVQRSLLRRPKFLKRIA